MTQDPSRDPDRSRGRRRCPERSGQDPPPESPREGTDRAPRDRRDRSGSPFTSPEGRRILRTLVGTMTGIGVLVGVTALALGSFGGPEVGLTPAAGTELPQEELITEYERKIDRTLQSYAAVKVSEFAAVVLAPLLGLRLGEESRSGHLLPIGVGAGIGATLLVAVAGLLATLRIPTFVVPAPGLSRLLTFTFRVRVPQLLTNAVLVGVVAAVAAVVAAYFARGERTVGT